jgi:hypothetical protein
MKRVRILTGKLGSGPVFVFVDAQATVIDRAVHGDVSLVEGRGDGVGGVAVLADRWVVA